MQITRFVDKVFGLNSYCIIENKHIVAIDLILSKKNKTFLSKYYLDFVIFTHEHFDHIRCINEIKKIANCPVVCGEKAEKGFSSPSINMSKYLDYLVTVIPFGNHNIEHKEYVCFPDFTVRNQQTLQWQNHSMLIKETPGHSVGSICILIDNQYLFAGDTIFKSHKTATKLPGGNTKDFIEITENWLSSLPQDIQVFPGHGKPFILSNRFK